MNSWITQEDQFWVLVIFALLLPPYSIYLHRGPGRDLVVSIVLTAFFLVPGSFHALVLMANHTQRTH